MFIALNDRISVAPQLSEADVARASEAGFTTLVNNRPDGETPDQPPGSAIEAAARAAGLAYRAIPITHGGFSMEQVEGMAEVMAEASGPVLAFCRSGTRSTMLWALAEARGGGDPQAIAATAAAAGYDISALLPTLRQLASR